MWTLALLLSILVPTQPQADARAPLTVSAAISLTEALEEIAGAYNRAGGGPVRFNFAGSNVLARQIVAGAPVDLFISADEAQMRVAEQAGAIDPATRVPLVGNRLAIVVRRGGPEVRAAQDLESSRIRRIALGDPAAVPAGAYARQYLESLDLWRRLERKVIPVGNVRAALAAVASGSVDAAFVYATDANASPAAGSVLVLTDSHSPRIVYPAAIAAASRHRRAAAAFLAFLRSAEASAILSRQGFTPLGSGR